MKTNKTLIIIFLFTALLLLTTFLVRTYYQFSVKKFYSADLEYRASREKEMEAHMMARIESLMLQATSSAKLTPTASKSGEILKGIQTKVTPKPTPSPID
jgi:regulatory protein YycI of two-component signal transduction system YycFG